MANRNDLERQLRRTYLPDRPTRPKGVMRLLWDQLFGKGLR
jgi:hypothetical protein